jgi:hypothetical protein
MFFLMKLITQCESHDQLVALVGRRNESYGGQGSVCGVNALPLPLPLPLP